ncbi:HAMP domain-containing histidine kinase [Gordonia sp. PP30]|uniref:sensor histidine kinase n=1 Tax=unclassified Gordonia (in: high G+C Gram-positive bacteria) TaxID=2657482 RepID=UPI0020003EBE|nr:MULTISPECIES: HAMP domain-containing sensor histidine kinase [unclassified Gordonia (in: high G+C Gram-positive bacteria)]UQE75993.1 HAMP domain-containing histidine kinase [Gordonia sp. PP30]
MLRWLPDRARSVRVRTTLLATGLVTLALLFAAVVMVLALKHILIRNADAATLARAHQIETALATDRPADLDRALFVAAGDVDVVQVIDDSGRVLLATDPRYSTPLSRPLAPGTRITIDDGHAAGDTDYRGSALGIRTGEGDLTVAVGTAEEPLNRLVVIVGVLCCILFPLIVIGMAVLTYLLVGRALRPVDDIASQVDEITGGDLSRRVPVPDTGDEIAGLAATMNRMLARIERSRREQLRFVGDASHELNSPLTTLVGLLDLARATGEPIDAETAGTVMLPDALRLQQMVADLLFLAQSDESGVPLATGEVDLDDVAAAEVTRLRAMTGLRVEARIVPVRIDADRDKIVRALRNLADNAVRYAAGAVSLRMSVDDAGVTLLVSDDGPGIPDGDKARVTERFVRLDDARGRTTGGSGLGLAIVTEIVHAHGGRMIVADSDSGGAAVGFTLPSTDDLPGFRTR